MKFAKTLFPLFLVTTTLCGCNPKEKGVTCLSNANYFLKENINGENKMLTGSLANVKTLMDLDITFLVYFHKPDCQWCDKFEPILDDYLTNYQTLVVDIPYEILNSFYSEFGSYYFETSSITFPYLGIMKGYNKCERVDNKKYMQERNAFKNYITSKVRNSEIYYADKSIENFKNTQEFTHISLDNTNETALNLYSTKVQEIALNSSKNIVISSNDSSALELTKIGADQQIKEKVQITNESEPQTIETFF